MKLYLKNLLAKAWPNIPKAIKGSYWVCVGSCLSILDHMFDTYGWLFLRKENIYQCLFLFAGLYRGQTVHRVILYLCYTHTQECGLLLLFHRFTNDYGLTCWCCAIGWPCLYTGDDIITNCYTKSICLYNSLSWPSGKNILALFKPHSRYCFIVSEYLHFENTE